MYTETERLSSPGARPAHGIEFATPGPGTAGSRRVARCLRWSEGEGWGEL